MSYNHILVNFERFQKFHFLIKSCILKAFGWALLTQNLTLVYSGFYSYLIKVSFPVNQAWRPRNEAFKFFRIKNDSF